jgi:6-phosphofructokinase 1
VKYCKTKNLLATLKYIDPTYMIRTVGANSYDVRMCSQLAAAAVHGGMAGFTGFLVGHVNKALAMIPVEVLFGKKGVVNVKGKAWQRMLAGTGQPDFMEPVEKNR